MTSSDIEAFAGLDDASLLALYSVLGAEHQYHRTALAKHVDFMERDAAASFESDERFRETLVQLSVLSDTVTNPEFHAGLEEFRAGLRQIEKDSERTAMSGAQVAEDLAAHAAELVTRQRRLVDELTRRGLLPAFPVRERPARG